MIDMIHLNIRWFPYSDDSRDNYRGTHQHLALCALNLVKDSPHMQCVRHYPVNDVMHVQHVCLLMRNKN